MENPSKDDSYVIVTLAAVIGILGLLSVGIGGLAGLMGGHNADEKAETAALVQRIAPIGKVVTDPAALIKAPVAAHVALSGEQVVGQVCSACHGAGVLGAPKIGDKVAWTARKTANGGVAGLAASAIKGKNSMPPRGGNPDLSDDEVKSAIEYMLKQTGVS